MKHKYPALLVLICFFQFIACKKESQPTVSQPQHIALLNFSINGEIANANIDTTSNTITVAVLHTLNMHSLTANFSLTGQTKAIMNNVSVSSGTTSDFSKEVIFIISSDDNKYSKSFKVDVQTDLAYFGLTGAIVSEKSLNKSYNFYLDQFDGSTYQNINCGPAVTTMSVKWADSTFKGTPASARQTIPAKGGWWYTTDVQNYLQMNGINSVIVSQSNLQQLVQQTIDNNNQLILCLDMGYVPYDGTYYHHVQKFYQTYGAGIGHFLLVKGYKQTSNNFYLEIYDPYTDHQTYTGLFDEEPRGKDRYYAAADITTATNAWWPFAIVVAPKGQQVTTSTKFTINSLAKIPAAMGR